MFDSVIDSLAESPDAQDIAFFQAGASVRCNAAVHKDFFSGEQRSRLCAGQTDKGGDNRIQALGGDIQPEGFVPGPELRYIR